MSKFHFEYAVGDPRGLMQRRVLPWLSAPDASLDPLITWLQGYDLPAPSDEPADDVLSGLPRGGEAAGAKRILTERVARLLSAEPDRQPEGEDPQGLLYNLLVLAARLRDPLRLGDDLAAMFERRALAGEWRGLQLRDALRDALAANQQDDRYRPIWQAMLLQRGPHEFLRGGPYDGFTGLLRMPLGPAQLGQPAREDIGWALRRMADYISERSRDRQRELYRELLKRVSAEYPSLLDAATAPIEDLFEGYPEPQPVVHAAGEVLDYSLRSKRPLMSDTLRGLYALPAIV